MIECKIYRGIEYIRIKELPEQQQHAIKNWLNRDIIIKIQTEKSLMSDCVMYKDYDFWFNNIYTEQQVATEARTPKVAVSSKKAVGTLAFD